MRYLQITVLLLFSTLFANISAKAQTDFFWANTLVGQSTTHQLGNTVLNATIMHSFGKVTDKPIRNFFGLDHIQGVRLGIDYGFTDWWSAGVSRSSLSKIYELRTKFALLQQSQSQKMPLNLSLAGNVAVITESDLRPFKDDISTYISVIASRKFNDTFALQITPIYAHFNDLFFSDENNFFALGVGTTIHFNFRYALIAEYYPVIGKRPKGTVNAFSIGLNVRIGGHVFQMFFASARRFIPQYIIVQNDDSFWAGDFRFGFNVNRLFR